MYMISGNHDSAERLSFGAKLFENAVVFIFRRFMMER